MNTFFNVGTYLCRRLKQLGINHLFSVPGDYTSDLLEIVDTDGEIQRIGNCNELNAGYAADGYARANGLGAVAVTTGVGSFSVLNATGGSYVEDIPVVVIIGTLSNSKLLDEVNAGERFHHNVNNDDFNRVVFSPVTVAFERIQNPVTAPAQIDAALLACISQSKPVALEISEDCYYMPCAAPVGNLIAEPSYVSLEVLRSLASATPPNKYAAQIVAAVTDAAAATFALLKASQRPMLWLGKEVSTYGLQYLFTALQQSISIPYASSLLGKAAIAEDDPWFVGMHDGVFTSAFVKTFTDECDCLIGLGVWNTDLNVFATKSLESGNPAPVFASKQMVKVNEDLYVQVSLEHFLQTLLDLVATRGYTSPWTQPASPPAIAPPPPADPITYDTFFQLLDAAILPSDIVVADVGLSTFGGSSGLRIKRQNGFLAQTLWASIGWSVPAGLGASFTNDSRVVVIVGDGAFKLTCQAVSTMVREKRNAVVFVLNNKVYGVEQMLLDPAPYQPNSEAPFEAANVLQPWSYKSLMSAFTNDDPTLGLGLDVHTVQDLHDALAQIHAAQAIPFLVNINLSERDYPAAWAPFVKL